MSSILIVPLGPAPVQIPLHIPDRIAEVFATPVRFHTGGPSDLRFAHDSSRNQYYSTSIIAMLLEQFADHQGKILAIATGDLFVPVLTYVFGEAQLDGPVALVSTHRLDERIYGLPQNDALFEDRLLKECIHELGHTFGLIHCRNYECVMHSSSAVEDVDVKTAELCEECGDELKRSRSRDMQEGSQPAT